METSVRMRNRNRLEQNKKLRKLYDEYNMKWHTSRDAGHFVDVEPYQRGWSRQYDLRDDVKNRRDANVLRQILQKINTVRYSSREDFTAWDYKTKKRVPMVQKLKIITVQEYDQLNEQMQKYFVKDFEYHKLTHSVWYFYKFSPTYYFTFVVEPNMITQHWIPDGDVETRIAEITNRVHRDNLWPKFGKLTSHGLSGWYDDDRSIYRKNKLGKLFVDEDFEIDEAA